MPPAPRRGARLRGDGRRRAGPHALSWAPAIREFLPAEQLLAYLSAILRVYNRYGRRDNIYKARIKILVASLGKDEFARQVEAEWTAMRERRRGGRPRSAAAETRPHPPPSFGSRDLRDPARAVSDVFEAASAADPAWRGSCATTSAAPPKARATPSSTSR